MPARFSSGTARKKNASTATSMNRRVQRTFGSIVSSIGQPPPRREQPRWPPLQKDDDQREHDDLPDHRRAGFHRLEILQQRLEVFAEEAKGKPRDDRAGELPHPADD